MTDLVTIINDNKKLYGELETGIINNEIQITGRIDTANTLGSFKNPTKDSERIKDIYFIKRTSNDTVKLLTSQKYNVTLLNFANSISVGGGVEEGATAQEEELCRTSPMLYNSLAQFSNGHKIDKRYRYTGWADFRLVNKWKNGWSNQILYTPDVIFRRDDGRSQYPYRILKEHWLKNLLFGSNDDEIYRAAIVTAAAPDWRYWRYDGNKFTYIPYHKTAKDMITVSGAEVSSTLIRMIEHIYYASINAKTHPEKIYWQYYGTTKNINVSELISIDNTALVLGPWGCGAFIPNSISDPDEYRKFMAHQFAISLKNLKKKYDRIYFAFLDSDSNYDIFLDVFKNYGFTVII